MKIAELVKAYRKSQGLSLRAFADNCGCSFQYISKLENGYVPRPSLDMITKICDGMGLSTSAVLAMVEDGDSVVDDSIFKNDRGLPLPAEYAEARDKLYSGYSTAEEKIQKTVCMLLDLDDIPAYKN